MLFSKRELNQCNHCQHAEWEYGVNVLYGWYVCRLKIYTKSDNECACFKHFNGILIRKQWLK